MQTIKCDRCGKELGYLERRHAQVKIRDVFYYLAEEFDLCKECKKELEDMFGKYEKEFCEWFWNKKK